MLAWRHGATTEEDVVQVGIDEAGRGPLFGRVYAAAAILPPPPLFDHSKMKDSKRFHSVKKLHEAAEYIKAHAFAWSVQYADEATIDRINIRNATHQAMHTAARDVLAQLADRVAAGGVLLVVDGNDFQPCMQVVSVVDEAGAPASASVQQVPHVCVEGGDNKYSMVAAASILAKTARDAYVEALCEEHPVLVERYDLRSNKGYGSKKHMDGIREHGISQWHRKSFGPCKTASVAQ